MPSLPLLTVETIWQTYLQFKACHKPDSFWMRSKSSANRLMDVFGQDFEGTLKVFHLYNTVALYVQKHRFEKQKSTFKKLYNQRSLTEWQTKLLMYFTFKLYKHELSSFKKTTLTIQVNSLPHFRKLYNSW